MKTTRAKRVTDTLIEDWIADTPLIVASGARETTDTFIFARSLSPSSRKTYYPVLKRFMDWAAANEIEHLTAVTSRNIASHIEGLVAHTAKTALTNPGKSRLISRTVLNTYFNALLTAGVVKSNPATGYRPRGHSRQSTPTAALTPSELLRMLDAIPRDTILGKRNRALVGLLAGSSCRVAAALGLTHQAFSYRNGTRSVTLMEKRQIPFTVPLSGTVQNLMRPYLSLDHPVDGGYIFAAWDKRRERLTSFPMSYAEAYRTIQAIAITAGIDDKTITPHSFRATAITALLEAGHDIQLAQRIANHADAATTRLYDRRDKAVKGEDMAELERVLKLRRA